MNINTFPFNELLLSSRILDRLGFSEYWDEHCTWGGRSITFAGDDSIRIIDQEEMDDDTEGNWYDGVHIAAHYRYSGWFDVPRRDEHDSDLYFLHQLYDVVETIYPQHIAEFIERCKKNNMGGYIESYLEFKTKQNAITEK